ncbi:WG repeat-containing protein, partial [Xanthovirga aplysinae]|uniref:WG repeat-containing protein n=1 Tax=Xanthovirga aplysinae TaxID=2529853 RepID=UPI0012BBFBDD
AVKDFQNKTALFNAKGEQLSSFKYDEIKPFHGDFALIHQKGKKGIINKNGKEIISAQYKELVFKGEGKVEAMSFLEWEILDQTAQKKGVLFFDQIQPIAPNLYKASTGKNQMLITPTNQFISEVQGLEIGALTDGYLLVQEAGKYGLMDENGKMALPTDFDSLKIKRDFFFVKKREGKEAKWVILNKKGKRINPLNYENIGHLQENGLYPVQRNKRWGYVNEQGIEIIPCKYDSIFDFKGGRAKVFYHDGYGLIDEEGNWKSRPFFENILLLDHENSIQIRKGESLLVDKEGRVLYKSENILKRKDGKSVIEIDSQGKMGLINSWGKRLLKIEYDKISQLLQDSVYVFQKGENFGVLSKSGRVLLGLNNPIQDFLGISDDYLAVKIKNRYGFVDVEGRLRIANRYEGIQPFSEEKAAVKILGKWGYVDKLERIIVQPHYKEVQSFKNGLAIVKESGKYGLINSKGELVQKAEFDKIQPLNDGKYISYKGNRLGLIDVDGRRISPPKYDAIKVLGNGFMIVQNNGLYGLLRKDGVSVIAPIYQSLVYDPYNQLYLVSKSSKSKTISMGH